jgi:DNA-binding transcriptional MerR regulator
MIAPFNKRHRAEVEHEPLLKIGEISGLSGIGIEALRFYEKSGLLRPASRTGSGYRLYSRNALDRLAFIKHAQMLGFSLDEVKQIISESESGQSPCRGVREVVRRRLRELDERMAQMKLYRKELASALEEWDKVEELEGHVCGLIESTEIHHPLSEKRGVAERKAGKHGKRDSEK